MKIVIGSTSPVKTEAVKRGFKALWPEENLIFECVKADSGVGDQPVSHDEMRAGALGRIRHAKSLSLDADYYVGLEGGVERIGDDLYNFGWVIVESKENKRGYGQTFGFMLPPAVTDLMLNHGMEQSYATDQVLAMSGTKTGTGTIGPLTNNSITYADWYVPAVIGALVPFFRADLYT